MKIAVLGAGAIGSFVAGQLARAGYDPVLIARGATKEAVAANGLTIEMDGELAHTPIRVTDTPSDIGEQDLVILATKAHQIVGALDTLEPMLGPDTAVAPAINGIPWWYCKGLDHPLGGSNLASCDPSGRIAAVIGVERVIGTVVYLATSIPTPGHVKSVGPKSLIIGEALGVPSPRLSAFNAALTTAGFDVTVTEDIRAAAFIKLWGNVHSNPMSVLIQGTMTEMLGDPLIADVSRKIMEETREVAGRFDVHFPMSIDYRLEEGMKLGAFRTSMLQDFDKGQAIELDAILGVISELGRKLDVPTPSVDILYALVRRRTDLTGCYFPPQ